MNRQYPAEEVVQCPYDPSHKVPRHRFQRHYRECQRSHPETILLSCPFDRSHRIPVAELDVSFKFVLICTARFYYFSTQTSTTQFSIQAHIRTCPTRAVFNQLKLNKPMKKKTMKTESI